VPPPTRSARLLHRPADSCSTEHLRVVIIFHRLRESQYAAIMFRPSSAAFCFILAVISSDPIWARLEGRGLQNAPAVATPTAVTPPVTAQVSATQHTSGHGMADHNQEWYTSHPQETEKYVSTYPHEAQEYAVSHPDAAQGYAATHPGATSHMNGGTSPSGGNHAAGLGAHNQEWVASHPQETQQYVAGHPGAAHEYAASHPGAAQGYAATHPGATSHMNGQTSPSGGNHAAGLGAHNQKWYTSHPQETQQYVAGHPAAAHEYGASHPGAAQGYAATHPSATDHMNGGDNPSGGSHNQEWVASHPHEAQEYVAGHPGAAHEYAASHPAAAHGYAASHQGATTHMNGENSPSGGNHNQEWVASHPHEAQEYVAGHPGSAHEYAASHPGAAQQYVATHPGATNHNNGGNTVTTASSANIETASLNTHMGGSFFLFVIGTMIGLAMGSVAYVAYKMEGKRRKAKEDGKVTVDVDDKVIQIPEGVFGC